MTTAVVFLDPLHEYLQFFVSSQTPPLIFSYLAYGLWLMVLLSGHLHIIPSISRRKRTTWSLGVALVSLAVIALFQFAERGWFSSGISVSTPLKAYGAGWLRTSTVDEFLQESREVKGKVDKLATEE